MVSVFVIVKSSFFIMLMKVSIMVDCLMNSCVLNSWMVVSWVLIFGCCVSCHFCFLINMRMVHIMGSSIMKRLSVNSSSHWIYSMYWCSMDSSGSVRSFDFNVSHLWFDIDNVSSLVNSNDMLWFVMNWNFDNSSLWLSINWLVIIPWLLIHNRSLYLNILRLMNSCISTMLWVLNYMRSLRNFNIPWVVFIDWNSHIAGLVMWRMAI